MNETLEAMARALFKSWFVDFDPVRAKSEGRELRLPDPMARVFPDTFEESELGTIPSGWSVGSILAHAELLSGGTPKTDRLDYWDGAIAWASAKDVSQCSDGFLLATERTITDKGLAESAARMIPSFATVVVARGATTGRMAILGDSMAMNQTCYALATSLDAPFTLYCQLRNKMHDVVRTAHGSVFDTITTETFRRAPFLLAPKKVVTVFEALVSPVFERSLAVCRENCTLTALRDVLLPKLISGELRLKDAERQVEAVL